VNSRSPYVKMWREMSAEKGMILIAGPRQSGKTTLARLLAEDFPNHEYLNWDIPEDRLRLVEKPHFFESMKRVDASEPLVVFDEIHKYRDWKNYLKGVVDRFPTGYRFLVTGSGRLDLYRKGGDSLAGRYLLFHLWPFTLAELAGRKTGVEEFLERPLAIDLDRRDELVGTWCALAELSGFPEPHLRGSKRSWRRWSRTYSQQLVREDVRDLTGIRSVDALETLFAILPSKVGSPLSVPSLCRDLKASYNTMRGWLSAFERFFLTFSVPTWSRKLARAILKERKVYLWDSPRIEDPGARFENMVALELRRAVSAWTELGYGRYGLHFLKNKEQQEVDFLISANDRPMLLVETKLKDPVPGKALRKFQQALGVPAVQLTNEGEDYRDFPNGEHRILSAPAWAWLSRLP